MKPEWVTLGSESLPFIELRKLEEEKRKIDSIPVPEKKDYFPGWEEAEKQKLMGQMELIALNVVRSAKKDLGDSFSIENSDMFDEYIWKNWDREAIKIMLPFAKLSYLPLIHAAKNEARYQLDELAWGNQKKSLDQLFSLTRGKIGKPFDPSLINQDPRFPIERVGQTSDGKFFDRWLTDALRGKLIFFDSSNYTQKLIEFYDKVYVDASIEDSRQLDIDRGIKPKPFIPESVPYDPGVSPDLLWTEKGEF